MRFDGRVALVTGASRGIGRATALTLARDGADVAVHYRRRAEDAALVCQEVRSFGRGAISTRCDVTDRPAVQQMVATVSHDLGPIELLVNNAGDAGEEEFARVTPDQWDHTIAVNLTGAFNVLWAVKGSMMTRTFGRIVNVSSVAAMAVRPNLLAYSAAKAGLNSLTKSCCEPFARYGIRINGVAPGIIDTEMAAGLSPAYIDQLRSATPLGRLGQAEEIAQVISFLLSENASYLTGTTVVASGGRFLLP